MKEQSIYDAWVEFIEQYKIYFRTNEENWYIMLEKIKTYIDNNDCRPPEESKDKDIKAMAKWISHQRTNSAKRLKLMSNDNIYAAWIEFIEQYKDYFRTNEEIWFCMLEKVKDYINKNHCRPSHNSEDKDIKKLGNWIRTQKENVRKQKKSMRNEKLLNAWNEFSEQYL
jgi:hypothetical protein